jgi:ATP-binding cassette subfamily B protein
VADEEPKAEEGALSHLDPRRLRSSGQLRLVRLAPRAHAVLAAVAALHLAVNIGIPTAFLVAGGRFVGAVPPALRDGAGSASADRLWRALLVLAVVYVSQQLLVPLLDTGTNALARRVDEHLTLRLMHAAAGPTSMAHLEETGTLDLIAQGAAWNTGMTPGPALAGMVQTWSWRLSSLASGIILLRFHWWAGLSLVAGPVVILGSWQRFFKEATQAIFVGTDELRRALYVSRLGMGSEPAKEVRIFGLGAWLHRRFHRTWEAAMAPVFLAWRSRRAFMVGIAALPGVLQALAFVVLAREGISGQLSLTEVTIFASAILSVVTIGGISDVDRMVAGGVASLRAVEELEARAAAAHARDDGATADAPAPQTAVRVEGLHFTYPGRETPVFDGLDLTLAAGKSTAVVGVNGAGKTTLVKLLCRLRDPDAGRITVDGVDLAGVDPARWQRSVAAIFQDFARYNLSAHDNIALGAPEHRDDRVGVVAAATRAGIADSIEALPDGWDTPLDRQRTGGAELSGGQWQRLAIARALFATAHGARVLVLDEPTAALDVRTEADLYDRFLELTHGVTTLVISHRFSTVRRADTIVVIDQGRVVEQGSHDELVAAGGHYAEMFDLQARRFLDEAPGEVRADA